MMINNFTISNKKILLFSTVVVLALIFSIWQVQTVDKQMRSKLLLQARLVASSLDYQRISNLNGSKEDLTNSDYLIIKQQLSDIKNSYDKCRFVYLYGRNSNKELYFFADNEQPDSEDYVPPGEIYSEATDGYKQIFESKESLVIGPVSDRWGNWVTALVPIYDKDTGEIRVVLGMDIEAGNWNWEIAKTSAMPILLVLFLLVLIAFGALFYWSLKMIRQSEKQYRLLFETAQEAIIVVQDGRLVYFNPVVMQITGYNEIELQNTNLELLVFEEERPLILENYRRRMEGESIPTRYQFRIVRKDGEVRWVDLSTALFQWNSQPATLNFLSDITDQVNASQALEKLNEELLASKEEVEVNLSQKNMLVDELSTLKEQLELVNSTKDKFFSIIAHDLKNPIGSFKLTTSMLKDYYDNMSSEEHKELIGLLYESTLSIHELLENLLQWSRSQRGTIKISLIDVNTKEIFDDTLRLFHQAASAKNINLVSNTEGNSVVFADHNLFKTILRNLVSNSIKFTSEGGLVEIGDLGCEKEMITIYIKDNGLGMTEETIGKLFKIDETVSSRGTGGEKGTGLGLILCKEFVDRLGGSIWVESEEGRGTTFFFTLPKYLPEMMQFEFE